jgi:isopenicillin N synthase-like dioxygenase
MPAAREVDKARRLAQAELEGLTRRQEHVEQLEKDRETLLRSMAKTLPDALQDLTLQERNKIYRMLRLEATPSEDGYEVSGAFCSSGLISPLARRKQSGVGEVLRATEFRKRAQTTHVTMCFPRCLHQM